MGNSANVLYIYNKSTETNKSLNAKKKETKGQIKKKAKCNMKMINTNTFRFT